MWSWVGTTAAMISKNNTSIAYQAQFILYIATQFIVTHNSATE